MQANFHITVIEKTLSYVYIFLKFPLSVDHLYDCNSVRPSLEIDLD